MRRLLTLLLIFLPCLSFGHSFKAKVMTQCESVSINRVSDVNDFSASDLLIVIKNNCYNKKWIDFKDHLYYNYIKSFPQGLKLYRYDNAEMILEAYVLRGIVKKLSSTFTISKLGPVMEELDENIMKWRPLNTFGDLMTEKTYCFTDYELILKNINIGISYTIMEPHKKASTQTKEVYEEINNQLDNDKSKLMEGGLNQNYSNKYYAIKYPSSWSLKTEKDENPNQMIFSTLLIKQTQNINFFKSNINILYSKYKQKKSAALISMNGIDRIKKRIPSYKLIDKIERVTIGKYKWAEVISSYEIEGKTLIVCTYVLKKSDDTMFIITSTVDSKDQKIQKFEVREILSSFIIKGM